MNTKICTKCKIERSLDGFSRESKRKFGYHPVCKICRNEYHKMWRHKNVEHTSEYHKCYYRGNKEQIKAYQKDYRQNNKGLIKERDKTYRQENKEQIKEQQKEYYQNNKEAVLGRHKQYRQENKEQTRAYYRNRLRNDICYKLAYGLRNRLRLALKNDQKVGSAVRDLGCPMEEFKTRLKSQFKCGMNWDNYGEWHIDHIRPLSSFDLTNREELLKACHYSNLQPLWKHENLSKGSKQI